MYYYKYGLLFKYLKSKIRSIFKLDKYDYDFISYKKQLQEDYEEWLGTIN